MSNLLRKPFIGTEPLTFSLLEFVESPLIILKLINVLKRIRFANLIHIKEKFIFRNTSIDCSIFMKIQSSVNLLSANADFS